MVDSYLHYDKVAHPLDLPSKLHIQNLQVPLFAESLHNADKMLQTLPTNCHICYHTILHIAYNHLSFFHPHLIGNFLYSLYNQLVILQHLQDPLPIHHLIFAELFFPSLFPSLHLPYRQKYIPWYVHVPESYKQVLSYNNPAYVDVLLLPWILPFRKSIPLYNNPPYVDVLLFHIDNPLSWKLLFDEAIHLLQQL